MKGPIRILHVFRCLNIGGAESMIMNLYRAMDRERIRFDFIVHTEKECAFDAEVGALGGRIYACPDYKSGRYLAYKRWWKDFFIAHNEYQIMHTHIRSASPMFVPIAKRAGLTVVSHSHTAPNGRGLVTLISKCMQFPLRYEADYFLGCSKAAGEYLFGKKAVRSERYHTLPNAIDTERYRFDPAVREEYRTQLDLGEGPVFLHIGNFRAMKNHMFLLDVFIEIRRRRPDSLLLLAGDGELRGEIEAGIERLGLQGAVRLLGIRRDVPQLLQAADCFLFPSLYEGLPVSVVEAQAAGLPCIISDRITAEVDLSELVCRLPVDRGPAIWAEQALLAGKRTDVCGKIKAAGFDVTATARWLTGFYEGLMHE